jgi:glycosyltransferase involved in cell wall biosynthesis
MKHEQKAISVIMPTYNNAAFINRAIASLRLQTFSHWELIIIDDGSTDDTQNQLACYGTDDRIRWYRHKNNQGLGAALNTGLAKAKYSLIAYLPADDLYFKDHLAILYKDLTDAQDAILAYASVLHHANIAYGNAFGKVSDGMIPGFPLQLVQVLHHKTTDTWMERETLVTDDLNKMFWLKLLQKGDAIQTGHVSCEWVDHPNQRHKLINERLGGGIYPYKKYYGIEKPIKFKSTVGELIDEVNYFAPFRKKHQPQSEGLKILLVGELAYNPERIYAFEENGHKLYGLWSPVTTNINTIGPLPFGFVENIAFENRAESIERIKPDIIYGLISYHTVSFAHSIMVENPHIPFVWHFKEGPQFCRQFGTWNKLVDLYSKADGKIYTNQLLKDWFDQFITTDPETQFVLDGELPKKDWFTGPPSQLLSSVDGEFHTVFVGRPIGLEQEHIEILTAQKIHLHFYGDIFHVAYQKLLDQAKQKAPNYIHTHPHCTPNNWVEEFSQYDAGWLHIFDSQNFGELLRTNWGDLNSPARLCTYGMAGIPMLQKDNSGHLVASQTIAQNLGAGLFFNSFEEVGSILSDKENVALARANSWNNRYYFSFDQHLPELIEFFKKIIRRKNNSISDQQMQCLAIDSQ